MTPGQRVFRHTAIQIFARAIGTVLGLVAIGIMARMLGREGFGAYTTVTAYLGVIAVFVDFGISTTLVAMLSEKHADEERLSGAALGLRIASASSAMALAVLASFALPYGTDIREGIAILSLSYVLVAVQQVQTAVFQRHVAMHLPAIAEILGRTLLVIGVVAAQRADAGLFGILAAVVVANAGQAALASMLLGRVAAVRPRFSFAEWKPIVARAWPVGVSILFNLIYLRADTVILSLTRPLAEVGLYGAAYRVVDVLTVFPMLFMGIVLPFLSRAWSEGDRERFRRTLSRALDALSLAAAPLAAGALAFGPSLLTLIAGEEFRSSGEVLRVLIVGVVAIMLAAAMTHAIVAVGAQRRMLPLLAADACVSFVLYIILIPRYGMWAAAWLTALSETVAAAAAFWVLFRASGIRATASVPLRAAAAAAGMFAIDLLLGGSSLAVRMPVAACTYVLLAVTLGAVRPGDIKDLLALDLKPTGRSD